MNHNLSQFPIIPVLLQNDFSGNPPDEYVRVITLRGNFVITSRDNFVIAKNYVD